MYLYAYVYCWISSNGIRYRKMPKRHVEFPEIVDVGTCELSSEGFVRSFLDEVHWVWSKAEVNLKGICEGTTCTQHSVLLHSIEKEQLQLNQVLEMTARLWQSLPPNCESQENYLFWSHLYWVFFSSQS